MGEDDDDDDDDDDNDEKDDGRSWRMGGETFSLPRDQPRMPHFAERRGERTTRDLASMACVARTRRTTSAVVCPGYINRERGVEEWRVEEVKGGEGGGEGGGVSERGLEAKRCV